MRLSDTLFITGTDTDIGKSVTTACLAAAIATALTEGLAADGLEAAKGPVRALKPIASGVPDGEPGDDAALLAYAAGHAVPPGGVRLLMAASPHRAAIAEGVALSPEAILDWIDEERGAITLVEGVGGWEVPITADFRVSALAERLGWPVLIVAGDKLGALNHTLLTVEAVRAKDLLVAGIVLVAGSEPTANLEDLRALLPNTPVRMLPRLPNLERQTLANAGRALLQGD